MAIQDLEARVFKAIDAVKAEINTAIAAISAEKADDVPLDEIASNGFYYEDWGMSVPTADPAILFAVEVRTEVTVGSGSSEIVRVMMQLCTTDGGSSGSEQLMRRLFRYRRALREVAAAQFRKFHALKIVDLPSEPLVVQQRNIYLLGIGIEFHNAY